MARAPELSKHRRSAHVIQQGSAAAAAAGEAQCTAHHAAGAPSAQAAWPGTDLLRFVPEQQFKLLQQSQQLVGLHQHMGASYGLSAAAVELASQEGKAALVVGSVHLAAQLWSELTDVQVRRSLPTTAG